MRVLERNKIKDTPILSRALEKLIKFLSKTYPSKCLLDCSPRQTNPYASNGLSTASNFQISTTLQSECSDLCEELQEINKFCDVKQLPNSLNNFNLTESKTSNDSNSLKDAVLSESKTEINGGSQV